MKRGGKEQRVEEKEEDLFRVGCVATTHGVRGEVKVYPTTEDPQRFKKYKEVLLVDPVGHRKQDSMQPGCMPLRCMPLRCMHIESVKFFKQMVIVKFRECGSMEEAERLRGAELYVPREKAVPLQKNEYYISDLIGMQVESEEGVQIGVLDDVLQTGANDVYVVKQADGKDILLPAIKECIKFVDVEARHMTVYLMPGLAE